MFSRNVAQVMQPDGKNFQPHMFYHKVKCKIIAVDSKKDIIICLQRLFYNCKYGILYNKSKDDKVVVNLIYD